MKSMRIEKLSFSPFDVPLREPFGIATGAQLVAHNVLVEVALEDGVCGLGEAAPFPAVNGETQAQVLEALPAVAEALKGQSLVALRPLAAQARRLLQATPSALAAVEMALLDAWTRTAKLPLWSFFGGSETRVRTDITIVTGTVAQAGQAAAQALTQGFDVLKLKIGGVPRPTDVDRVVAAAERHPRARFILDANGSMSADEALAFVRALGPLAQRVALFEQPTPADDLEALARVNADAGIPVVADESARSVGHVVALARRRAAQAINIKTMKTGVFEAWDMMVTARAFGLDLMVGGMVETELAMTVSACLGAGVGGVSFYDLDTPLFMGERPLRGGFVQTGPDLDLSQIEAGHGVTWQR